MPTTPERLQELYREKERLKCAVTDWMNAEAKQLRLARNGDAPMWYAYTQAEHALAEELTLLDTEEE